MTNSDIIHVLQEASIAIHHSVDISLLSHVESNRRIYLASEYNELKRDLTEAARNVNLLMLEYTLSSDALSDFIMDSSEVILMFKQHDNEITPVLFKKEKGYIHLLSTQTTLPLADFLSQHQLLQTSGGKTICFVILPYRSFVSEPQNENGESHISPVKRLLRLLGTERKDITYIFIYATIIGLVGLILPLGLQTTIELISGGVFSNSVYLLIALVIFGVLITGIFQVIQMTMVEHLQRRIFTKAAFEFAYRIPRIRIESLLKNYAPELVNRFFDVITIQKGLPKLLIDLSSGVIQILFGMLLLSLYHPFFVFFSFFLILVLVLIIRLTGQRGLNSSLDESKYKYKVVHWLEELARAINSFKLAGNMDLPIKRTDHTVGNYLKHRKSHFKVLLSQYSSFIFFKVAVTGGLLIMGTILVIDREITLGQFVASEVIIILVLNAVEKIIMYTDVVYDMLTAVDKVAHLTDLPLEKTGGFDFPKNATTEGYEVDIRNLNYRFKDASSDTLKNINLSIGKREKVCIAGPGGSGKTTLMNIIAGLYHDYSGAVSINKFSLHDLDLSHLRNKVAKNITSDDLFDGTLYDNLTLGNSSITVEQVMNVLNLVDLQETTGSMPQGLQTHILSGGKGFSNSTIHKFILARCLLKKPELLILNDFFSGLSKADKLELIQCVINPSATWTMIAVSNDPLVMASCDRVVVMDNGKIVADDSYENLLAKGIINQYFE